MIKYEVTSQLTGIPEAVSSFEEAEILRDTFLKQYIEQMVVPLFPISVLIKNEDGSWTQALADDKGEPIVISDDGSAYSITTDKTTTVEFLP